MEISRLHCDKINIGGDDVSWIPPDKTANGTLVANGPVFFGLPTAAPNPTAVLNIGPSETKQAPYNLQEDLEVPLSLQVDGNTVMIGNSKTPDALDITGNIKHVGDTHHTGNKTHNGNLIVSNLITCTGQGCAWTGSTINVQGWKGFDIKHPLKKGHRLRYICLEGPEGAVYVRGRIKDKNIIKLPDYWEKLVDTSTITVNLTPFGTHQDVIVTKIEPTEIHLQSSGPMNIDCFYHVIGARADGEKLTPEYEGETPQDYPGNNEQYSIAGYHYDRRTL